MKALLVGQSTDLTKDVPFCLRLRWPDIEVHVCAAAPEAFDLIKEGQPDVVICDYHLHGIHCLEMVNQVRDFSDVPMVVLMGGDIADMDRAKVLEAGADDYILVPCSAVDVLSKLRAVLRRTSGEGFRRGEPPRVWGDLAIEFNTRRVTVGGTAVKLTPREYDLLVELTRNEGRVVTERELLQRVWGPQYAGASDLIKKYVYRLRRKLNDDPRHPHLIVTAHGVGYRFLGGS